MARWGDHAYRLKGNVIPAGNPVHMNPEDIMRRLEILREEHRDLDTAIMALIDSGGRDQLQLARLKKRKLLLRDEIAILEDTLIHAIIAKDGARSQTTPELMLDKKGTGHG